MSRRRSPALLGEPPEAGEHASDATAPFVPQRLPGSTRVVGDRRPRGSNSWADGRGRRSDGAAASVSRDRPCGERVPRSGVEEDPVPAPSIGRLVCVSTRQDHHNGLAATSLRRTPGSPTAQFQALEARLTVLDRKDDRGRTDRASRAIAASPERNRRREGKSNHPVAIACGSRLVTLRRAAIPLQFSVRGDHHHVGNS